ncbi:arylamine N-acetyltransferase [Parvibaculaceae bacterium PLY_AMNH_Bact1]|nr:arylamine N-acetyltransferase [Parvibaculaceae bacterium PLY_AMNH_Bact1]
MSDAQIDLDAYFARIGYEGGREPTLENLTAIQFAHATSVPFENLSILFGRGVQLDLATLQSKIVGACRGGYCFEQNGLALAALRQLGFQATGLIGRVRWMVADEVAAPLTHMLIRVDFEDGTYIYDGGFGGIRLTGVLKLVPDLVQQTRHEDHRIVQNGENYTIQADLGKQWANVCVFTLTPQSPVDYELSSWYTSTHPESLFTNNLIVERPSAEARRMIFNNTFVERKQGEDQTVHEIADVEEMVALLDQHFGLPVETDEQRKILERFLTPSAL